MHHTGEANEQVFRTSEFTSSLQVELAHLSPATAASSTASKHLDRLVRTTSACPVVQVRRKGTGSDGIVFGEGMVFCSEVGNCPIRVTRCREKVAYRSKKCRVVKRIELFVELSSALLSIRVGQMKASGVVRIFFM